MKQNSRKILYNMIFIATFSALTYAATFVAIPTGISKVHFGNFIGIIASLLCGPLIGGISASLGMGLNDLTLGYGPDTVIRTFVVKFLMAFIAGLLFRFIVKKKTKINYLYLIFIFLFMAIFITFLVLYIVNGDSFKIGDRTFTNSLFLIISSGLMSGFFIVIFFFSKKIKPIQQYVLFATSVASLLNIIFEFALKIPLKMAFAGMNSTQAFIYSLTSLPSAIITAIVTIIVITILYIPIYYATKNYNRLNTLNEDIQALTTWKKDDLKEEKISEDK